MKALHTVLLPHAPRWSSAALAAAASLRTGTVMEERTALMDLMNPTPAPYLLEHATVTNFAVMMEGALRHLGSVMGTMTVAT